jgi:hypothetical protein
MGKYRVVFYFKLVWCMADMDKEFDVVQGVKADNIHFFSEEGFYCFMSGI